MIYGLDIVCVNRIFQLHQHMYDTGKALQALVKIVNPKSIDRRWSDEDAVCSAYLLTWSCGVGGWGGGVGVVVFID